MITETHPDAGLPHGKHCYEDNMIACTKVTAGEASKQHIGASPQYPPSSSRLGLASALLHSTRLQWFHRQSDALRSPSSPSLKAGTWCSSSSFPVDTNCSPHHLTEGTQTSRIPVQPRRDDKACSTVTPAVTN